VVLLIIIFSVGMAMDGEIAINFMIALDIMNQDIEGINREDMSIISQTPGGNMASINTIGVDIESLNIENMVIRKQG